MQQRPSVFNYTDSSRFVKGDRAVFYSHSTTWYIMTKWAMLPSRMNR